jgi:protein-tyrosine phosphatase
VTGQDGEAPLRVLVVCTGNVCRSPAGEHLLRAALADLSTHVPPGAGVDVASAGTMAPTGRALDPLTGEALLGRGIDASGHRARRLTRDDVAAADLVLTATREHRTDAVRLLPAAVNRTYTLSEFGRLAAAAHADGFRAEGPLSERMRALVAAARILRGTVSVSEDDDLPDPIGRPLDVHQDVVGRIGDALAAVVSALG